VQLTSREHAGVLVVSIAGRVTGDDHTVMRTAMADVHARGHRRVVLDLAQLDYLDSAALGEIVAWQVRAIKLGAPLKIANPGKRLEDLLVLTRLTTVFETHDSLSAAIESFDEAAEER
jgi:anti-sigma B factor antagonist